MSKFKKLTTIVPTPLQIVTTKADGLELQIRTRRGIYSPVIDKIAGLKKGEALLIVIPADTDYSTMSNRITSAIANNKNLSAPAGCYFAKRLTKDGRLAVLVLPKKVEKAKASK